MNYPRRDACHLCGRDRPPGATKIVMDYVERLKKHRTGAPLSRSGDGGGGETHSKRGFHHGGGSYGSHHHPGVSHYPRSSYGGSASSGVNPTDAELIAMSGGGNNAPGMRAEIINMKFKTKLCKQYIEESGCLR